MKLPAGAIPRNSQSDVHLPSACKVEGVEGHLGGGLPDGLGRQQAHRLARVAQRTLPLVVQQLAEAADTERETLVQACKRRELELEVGRLIDLSIAKEIDLLYVKNSVHLPDPLFTYAFF